MPASSVRAPAGPLPTTFEERGAMVPFTTPLLTSARVRIAGSAGLEYLIANPAGARGQYVLHWGQVGAMCCPTVHDRRLYQHLGRLAAGSPDTLTPGMVRAAVRAVAAEGLAGRAARANARLVVDAEREARATLAAWLLADLVSAAEPAGSMTGSPTGAARLAGGADAIGAMLEGIAALFVAVGLPGATTARLPRLLKRLAEVEQALHRWAGERADRSAGDADGVAAAIAPVLALATIALDAARGALARPTLPLLRRWQEDPGGLRRLAARPDWVLDGWDEICLLWEDADSNDRRPAALAEMLALLPRAPREAGPIAAGPTRATPDRIVALNEDWWSGLRVADLVSRNERLLARGL